MQDPTSPFYYPIQNVSLVSKTLVVPVVSTANIAQLAVDLVITNLSLTRIGVFDDVYLVPAVGGREDGQPGITTPLELYGRPGVDVIVVQQRTPVLKAFKETFVENFARWTSKSGVKSVILLSGLDLSNRTDAQMLTPTYHLLPSRSDVGFPPDINLEDLPELHQEKEGDRRLRLPGSGLTRRLLESPRLVTIPRIAVLQFVMEGDNRHDAHYFARRVLRILNLRTEELDHVAPLKEPPSWMGLFGQIHDQTLFG